MKTKSVFFGGTKFVIEQGTYWFPTKDAAHQGLNKKHLTYIWDRFCKVANKTPTVIFNVMVTDNNDYKKLGQAIKDVPSNVRLPDILKEELGLFSPLREYAERVEGLSKKHKDYCLACIDEFKPDLEEFINAVIEEVQIDANQL